MIGLITFHRTSNFGSALQTYGLYKKITDITSDVEIIDYRCEAIEQRENRQTKFDLKNPKQLIKTIIFQPRQKAKGKALDDFIANNSKLSKPYTKKNISECSSKYEKIIVGSDIVWGRDITDDDLTYFLDFADQSVSKYAFSSSVGYYEEKENDKKVGELLRQFKTIAVREKDAVDWVKRISGEDSLWVCDPTMLLTIEEWETVIQPKKYKEDYVLVYFDNEGRKGLHDAKIYAKANGLKVVLINYSVPQKNVKNVRPKNLNEFLGYIKNASRIFTASYHGLLFSIYYQKNVCFYTRDHSTRVLSLADRLGLMNCCADKIDIQKPIPVVDYSLVNKRLEEFRKESIECLRNMIEEKMA